MKSTIMVKEIYEAFKSVGAQEDVASAAAQAVPPIEILATKADIAEVKGDVAAVKGDVAAVKADIAEVKGDVADLKADIAAVKGDVADLKGAVADLKGVVADLRGGLYRHFWLMGTGLLAAMVGLRIFG